MLLPCACGDTAMNRPNVQPLVQSTLWMTTCTLNSHDSGSGLMGVTRLHTLPLYHKCQSELSA